jgi:hypothetical protein
LLRTRNNAKGDGAPDPCATPRSRRLALWVVLVVALAFAACSKPGAQQASVFIDPALSTLIAADTTVLAGARIDSLSKTPAYAKLVQNPVIQDVSHRTNIDPQKQLWSLMFASNGRKGLVLARGKFADELMAPDLRAEGVERMGYKGLTMWGNEQDALLFFNSSTAAVGDTNAIRALVDERPTIKALPARFDPLVKSIPKEAQIWGAYAGGPVDLPLRGNLANVTNVLGMVDNATFWATVDDKAHVTASLLAGSDQKADDLNGALQALMALSKTQGQLTKSGRAITVKLDVSF